MKIAFIIDDFVVEPLGIGYLSAVLKEKGHRTLLIKSNNFNEMAIDLDTFRPEVLAFSTTTGKHRYYQRLNTAIKTTLLPRPVSIFGGSHPTYFPEIANDKNIDYIIRGEGEELFCNLIETMEYGSLNGKIHGFCSLEQDLDKIPFPNREFLYRYLKNRDNPIKNVITSRGCPYNCSYCYNSLYRSFYKGQKWVRYRSPENVVKECIELKKYPLKMIFFEDDEFISNKERLHKLLKLYREKVRIPFHCQIRIEQIDWKTAWELKDAGCTGVTYAVESGDYFIREKMLKRNISPETILKGATILNTVGLKTRVQSMCGLPTELEDEAFHTFDLTVRCEPTVGWMSIFQPYPRLQLGEICKKEGLWDGDVDKIRETFFEKTVLKFEDDGRFFNNFQKLFMFFVNYPKLKWLFKLLVKFPENKVFNWFYYWYKKRMYRRLYGNLN